MVFLTQRPLVWNIWNSQVEIGQGINEKSTLETVSIAEPLQNRQHAP